MSEHDVQAMNRQGGFGSIVARLFWMVGGNVVLIGSSISILQHQGEILHVADLLFWITVPAMIVARYFDIRLWDGQTAMGTPATMAHWRRYAAGVLGGSAVVWLLCHAVNYLSTAR